MPLARYDRDKKELSIRLSADEPEKGLTILADLLPQFLDRELRELGLAIREAMKPDAISRNGNHRNGQGKVTNVRGV